MKASAGGRKGETVSPRRIQRTQTTAEYSVVGYSRELLQSIAELYALTLLEPHSRFEDKPLKFPSSSPPKRDCGPNLTNDHHS